MSKSCEAVVGRPPVDLVGFLVALDGPRRLRFWGELDASEVPRVRACLAGADGDLELDCAGLSFIDAAGLGLLVELDTECRARHAKLLVINPSRCLTRLLELTGLDSVLTVQPEVSAR